MKEMAIIIAAVFTGFFMWYLNTISTDSSHQRQRFNNWASQCRQDGGALQLVEVFDGAQKYECFKNGQIINHMD